MKYPVASKGLFVFLWGLFGILLVTPAAHAMGAKPPLDIYKPGKANSASLAPVKLNGAWGYINGDGEVVIPPKFLSAQAFQQNSLAIVQHTNKKWGAITEDGAWAVQPQFDFLGAFSTIRGKLYFFSDQLALAKNQGKYGYVDTRGAWVIEAQFADAHPFSTNGLAFVTETKSGKRGFIDIKGRWKYALPVADGQEAFVFPFTQGLAAVCFDISSQNGKCGFIGEDGLWVILPDLRFAWSFAANGLAAAVDSTAPAGRNAGYINRQGEWVLQPQFKDALPFTEDGLAFVQSLDKGWGFITPEGELRIQGLESPYGFFDAFALLAANFGEFWYYAANGYAKAVQDGQYGFIDKEGNWAINPTYDHANNFFDNGIAEVTKDERRFFINAHEVVIASIEQQCGTDVVKNRYGNIVFPQNITEICAASEAKQ